MGSRSAWIRLLAVWTVTAAPCLDVSAGPSSKLVCSTETTYVTAPCDPARSVVGYCEFLNSTLGKDVSKENNAIVPILLALGPSCLPENVRAETLKSLELDIPARRSARFEEFESFLLSSGAESAGDDRVDELLDEQERTMHEPWSREDHPEILQWLDRNEAPIELLKEGGTRSRLFLPLPCNQNANATLLSREFLVENLVRGLTGSLSCRAMLRLGSGNVEEAWGDARSLYRLGALLATQRWVMPYLAGCGLRQNASRVVLQIARSPDMPGSLLRRILTEIRAVPEVERARSVYLVERLMALDAVVAANRGELSEDFGELVVGSIDVNSTLRVINAWYDRIENALNQRRLPRQLQDLETFAAEFEKAMDSIARRSAEEKLALNVLALMVTSPATVAIEAARTTALEDLATCAIALAVFRVEKGSFPERLDSLAPTYLSEVPVDVFGDGALKYRRIGAGYLLYSIGEDRVDGGGTSEDGADLVVRVE